MTTDTSTGTATGADTEEDAGAGADITVMICDDDARICQALRLLVDSQPDLSTVAVARDRDQALMLARRHQPAVAIVDVRMPGGGARAAEGIRERSPDTRVLAFSAHDDNAAIREMKRAGAAGYLVKGTAVRNIVAAIRGLAHKAHGDAGEMIEAANETSEVNTGMEADMETAFDPFVASDPPVLVHEVDGPDFELAWQRFDGAADGGERDVLCPVCGKGRPRDRGTSPRKNRAWIRFSCGDVIAQEVTAG